MEPGKATPFFLVDWMVVWCAMLRFLIMTKYTQHSKIQSVLRKVRGLLGFLHHQLLKLALSTHNQN